MLSDLQTAMFSAALCRAAGLRIAIHGGHLALVGRAAREPYWQQHFEAARWHIARALLVGIPIEVDRNLRAVGASWPSFAGRG